MRLRELLRKGGQEPSQQARGSMIESDAVGPLSPQQARKRADDRAKQMRKANEITQIASIKASRIKTDQAEKDRS